MRALEEAALFVARNLDVFKAVAEAITKGTPKEALLESIRSAAVLASDELMRKELGEDE